MVCDYCGKRFNVTTQLSDRNWAYRRSGLFGRDDHQQGAIPVALTLQQVDTVLHHGDLVYSTSMILESSSAEIEHCETDFVILTSKGYRDHLIELAVAECKGQGEITEEDVRKLAKVADAFPANRVQPYIIFAKTAAFSPKEISRCKAAQPNGRARVILLSDRELEPYFAYQRAEKEFEIRSSVISLEGMAQATKVIYLDPKPRRG
jgi:hypothetical protein